jgi:UDP-N-acetyl-D-mannosaminuronate dehydrogenase
VGGHCIPIYPQFYLWGDSNASIVREARRQNESMPKYAVEKIEACLGSLKGMHVLVLGASYRDGVKETAFSGAFELKRQLEDKEANVDFYDSLFSKEELNSLGLCDVSEDLEKYEIVVVQHSSSTNSEFITTNPRLKNVKIVFDGRNLFKGNSPIANAKLITLGNGLTVNRNFYSINE